ncbi:MAG TPA: hypothetical protein VKS79_26120 [Gemmataceae bacterium]|nr:hypothetical protein [Gemmataceae bacterium]
MGVEVLEGRALPSVVGASAFQLANVSAVVSEMPQYVPNLQGVSFYLTSSNGKPAHTFVIQSECWHADGSAGFTGTWAGEGGTVHQVTGTLAFDAQGNISIHFSWTNGQGSTNSLQGTITRVHSPYGDIAAFPQVWHLEGDVTSPTGGGPGHVSGNGSAPLLAYAMP